MHLLIFFIMLCIYGFTKLVDWGMNTGNTQDFYRAWELAIKFGHISDEETFEYKGNNYLISTGEQVQIWHNKQTGEEEYYTLQGKQILTQVQQRRQDAIDSGWKTVYWVEDKALGALYKDIKTNRIYTIQHIWQGGYCCSVYVDTETGEYLRPSDGEYNRKNRMEKYSECYNHKFHVGDWKKGIKEENERIQRFKEMDKYSPKYEGELTNYRCITSSGWKDREEFNMPWLGKVDENGKPIVEELPCV